MKIKGDRKRLLRIIRKECYRMDRKSRAELVRAVEALDEYWIPYRMGQKHRKIFGYESFPIAFAVGSKWEIISASGFGFLKMRED